MLSPKSVLVVGLAKILAKTIRTLNLGGATAAPGLLVNQLDPQFLSKISRQHKKGNILISGTNGKTTTGRIIAEILKEADFKILQNRAGSNLLRGVTTSLIEACSVTGKLNYDLGVWEIDEATLPKAAKILKPKLIILLNLFRDQLDRFWEVDKIRKRWQEALNKTNYQTTLVLNADDPGIAILGKNSKAKVVYFSLHDKSIKTQKINQVADIRHCLICDSPLFYRKVFTSHMGDYLCRNCGFRRPQTGVCAIKVKTSLKGQSKISLKGKPPVEINYQLPGIYNAYNALAAYTAGKILGVSPQISKRGISKVKSAFGRTEKIEVNGKKCLLFLVKNPVGYNEVLRTIKEKEGLNLLFFLNDQIADGKDVSWIWDVDFESLKNNVSKIFVSGLRGYDMALRLKYAGIKPDMIFTHNNHYKPLEKSLRKLDKKDTLIILPTYTAMLELRKELGKKKIAPKFWEN